MFNFCPFIQSECRDDCVFYAKTATAQGITTCKIYSGLEDIEESGNLLAKISDELENITR